MSFAAEESSLGGNISIEHLPLAFMFKGRPCELCGTRPVGQEPVLGFLGYKRVTLIDGYLGAY